MTSSLVGSEMCIRDRLSRAWALLSCLTRSCFSSVSCQPEPSEQPSAPPCLLYTSDAADDM
eukprot:7318758-Prorocentrum_lima.AAC.1